MKRDSVFVPGKRVYDSVRSGAARIKCNACGRLYRRQPGIIIGIVQIQQCDCDSLGTVVRKRP